MENNSKGLGLYKHEKYLQSKFLQSKKIYYILLFYSQLHNENRNRRIAGPIIIFRFNHQIFFRIQTLHILQHRIFLFKSRIAPAVNTQGHKAFLFQKSQPSLNCLNAAVCPGSFLMVTSRQISQIKRDAGNRFRLGVQPIFSWDSR